MDDAVTFSQEEMLMIRDQYVARAEHLSRHNEELELRLRRALNQMRSVEEILHRAMEDVRLFEQELVRMVDEADILAELPVMPKAEPPRKTASVVIRDVPVASPTARPAPVLVHPRRSVYAATAVGTLPLIPAVPAVPLRPSDDVVEVGDDMVVEDLRQATVVAATVPLPPRLSGPMPGAPVGSALYKVLSNAHRAQRLRPTA